MGGDILDAVVFPHRAVSIHATRVGGDKQVAQQVYPLAVFLSTPPVWVATVFIFKFAFTV